MRIVRCLEFLFFLGTALYAQQRSGSVRGFVQDPSGAAIPGATITLERGKSVLKTTSSETGEFRFGPALSGEYTLTVRFANFELHRANIAPGPTPLQIRLDLEALRQEVVVEERPEYVGTESASNRNAVVAGSGMLEGLPVFDQDYIATMSRFLDSGALATGGVTLVVDGVEANGPGVSPSAIKEVRINSDPYSAEFSRPGTGRVEIITKQGSPQFHGTINAIFRDHRLNARDPFALTRPDEQRRIYEGSVAGPLGDGRKNAFLVSWDRQEQDLQAVVFGQGLDGPIRQNVATPQRRTFVAGRWNHVFSPNHSTWLGYSYDDRHAENQGVGGTALAGSGSNVGYREDEITLNDRAVLTPRLTHNLRFLVGRFDVPTTSTSTDQRIVVLDAFTSGAAQVDSLRTERHWDATELMTWARGRHTVKFGVDIPDWSRRGFTLSLNRLGTYTFSSLADYAARRPISFTQQSGNGHIVFLEKVLSGFVQDEFQLRPNLSVSLGLRYYWQNYFHDDPNNFAPRAAFAWAPGRNRKTVVRGGAGFFYDRTGPAPIAEILLYDDLHLRKYVITNPVWGDPFQAVGIPPNSLVRLDPSLKIPYTIQYSAGIERQILKSATLSAMYTGTRGISLFTSRDVNAPRSPLYLARPDPRYGQIRQIESSGRQESNSLEVAFRGKVGKRFTGVAQYRLSEAHNNTAGYLSFPANHQTYEGEWGRAEYDRRHRFNLLGTIDSGAWLHFGIALLMYSGAPVNVITGRDDNHDGLALERPAGTPRNSMQGPGYAAIDLRWSREFLLSVKKEKGPVLTTGIDAFNLTNRVNYTTYSGTLTSSFFGKPLASEPARHLQISMRLRF